MANTEIFKTVFKGYSKDEVISYIENLNSQLSSLNEALADANNRLMQYEEEQLETAHEIKQQALDEEELRRGIFEEVATSIRSDVLKEVEESLRPQIEKEARRKLEEEMAAKYEEVARAEINQRLQNQATELQELRHKAQLYDDNREVFAELMIKAKNDAAGIVKDAEEQAKKLREDAEQRYNLLISDYGFLKLNLLAAQKEAADKLHLALKGLDDFEKKFHGMDHDVRASAEHLSE